MTGEYCLRAQAVFSEVPEKYRDALVHVPMPEGAKELTQDLLEQVKPVVGASLDRMVADAGLKGALLEFVSYEVVRTPEDIRKALVGGDG